MPITKNVQIIKDGQVYFLVISQNVPIQTHQSIIAAVKKHTRYFAFSKGNDVTKKQIDYAESIYQFLPGYSFNERDIISYLEGYLSNFN